MMQGKGVKLLSRRWGIVPLDERPITYKPLKPMLKLLGLKLKLMSPRLLTDNFHLKGWRLIIFLDRYLYGGLIDSRDVKTVSSRQARDRERALIELLRRLSSNDNEVFLISSIPRLLPTGVIDDKLMELILDFHATCYEHTHGSSPVWSEYERIAKDFWAVRDILREHLMLRRAKYELHKRLIDELYTMRNVQLIIALDDHQVESIASIEYQDFLRMARKLGGLHALIGVDQVAYQVTLRALRQDLRLITEEGEDELRLSLKLSYRFPHNLGASLIYEPLTLEELIRQNYKFCKLRRGAGTKLYVNNFKGEQLEAVAQLEELGISSWADVKVLLSEISPPKFMKGVTKVADVQYANGGSLELLGHIADNSDSLEVYWAWNTTANTLGSAIAHAVIVDLSKRLGTFNIAVNRQILWERVLEDAIYQPLVRPLINAKLREEGEDPYNLSQEMSFRVKEVIREMLNEVVESLELPVRVREVSLPLNRTFEVDLDLTERR